jgi:hypothetical protein
LPWVGEVLHRNVWDVTSVQRSVQFGVSITL